MCERQEESYQYSSFIGIDLDPSRKIVINANALTIEFPGQKNGFERNIIH